MTSLLTLLPLLLSVAAFAAGSFLVLHENRRALFECRSGLIGAEDDLVGDMNKLLTLNTQARALRAHKLAAEAAVAASASNPLTLALAQSDLRSVVTQQEALDVVQKSLIAHGNTSARVHARSVAKKVSDRVTSVETPTMAVKPTSPGIAPEYQVTPDIEQKHTIRINWKFQPLRFLPTWMNQLLGQVPLQFSTECSASAEKGDTKWQPHLKRGKVWSS